MSLPRTSPDDPSSDPAARLSPQAAASLLALRRKARVRYEDYLQYWLIATKSQFSWNWHWSYLADIMQAVADRDPALRFLIVNIPPRFAKSTLLSQQWQPWMIGRQNNRRSSLFSISSSGNLAARDSRTSLETIRSEWYRALFPHVAIGNKETEAEWHTSGGAYRIACGRDGLVTGRGADHLLVDDLVSAQEADSETIREQGNEFLGRSLRSRMDDQKHGTITNIQQRLHELDATGFLLQQSKIVGADQYHLISIPNEATIYEVVQFNGRIYAERKPGDLLHPERMGPAETAAIRISQKNNYEGQYQQNPCKMEGAHLDPRRLLRLRGTALELKSSLGLTPNFYLDFAATEKQTQKNDPDYSVILVAARDQLDRLIILDIWRKQTPDYSLVARTLIQMWRIWLPRAVKGERGALLNLFQPSLKIQQSLTSTYFALEPLPARRRDKTERSMPFQAMLNAGMVAIPETANWAIDFERELRAFPKGAHDDMVDPASDAAIDHPVMPRGTTAAILPSSEKALENLYRIERYEKIKADMQNPSDYDANAPGSDWG